MAKKKKDELEPGWLKEQLEENQRDIYNWPEWMKKAAKIGDFSIKEVEKRFFNKKQKRETEYYFQKFRIVVAEAEDGEILLKVLDKTNNKICVRAILK